MMKMEKRMIKLANIKLNISLKLINHLIFLPMLIRETCIPFDREWVATLVILSKDTRKDRGHKVLFCIVYQLFCM